MSNITIRIMDEQLQQPIAEAGVYLVDDSGNNISLIGYADNDGMLSAEVAEGSSIKVSFPGYVPSIVDTSNLSGLAVVTLKPTTSSSLDDVIIKSVKKKIATLTHPDNYTLPIVLGSAALVTFGIWLYKTSA